VTLPHPSDADTRYVVRRVVFTINSHDQGFSNEEGHLRKTYEHSWTNFDARVVQPSGQDRIRRRRVQTNAHAWRYYIKHVVCWDYRDERGPDELLDESRKTGRHWGREFWRTWRDWLGSIQSGDSIHLIPRAYYPAWTNYVDFAQIEVWAESVGTGSLGRQLSFGSWNNYAMYRPLQLEGKEIRVVDIEPTKESDDDICLSIRYISLAGSTPHVPYDALSYCWGAPEDPEPVYIQLEREGEDETSSYGRSSIMVNRSLFAALKRLRQPEKVQTLWIDLICINQNNLEERAQQVALMGDIFGRAETVHVWLGEGSPTMYEAFDDIKTIQDRYCHDANHNITSKPQETHEFMLSRHDQWALHNDTLFELPWFRRVWVLQEVWNRHSPDPGGSMRPVAVLCGPKKVSWESVMQANICFSDMKRHLRTTNDQLSPPLWASLFSIGRTVSEGLSVSPSSRLDILDMAIRGLDLMASDPRDKIFALLTFGKETYEIASLPSTVRPDYSKSVDRVFCDFTRWWICRHNSLRILSTVNALTGRTWVDLSEPNRSSHKASDLGHLGHPSWCFWHEGHSDWSYGTLALPESNDYRASGDTHVDLDLLAVPQVTAGPSEDPHLTLRLRGRLIATITCLQPYPFFAKAIKPHPYFRRIIPSEVLSEYSAAQGPWENEMAEAYARIFDPASSIGTWLPAKPWGTRIEKRTAEEGSGWMNYWDHNLNRDAILHHWRCHNLGYVGGWPCYGGKEMFTASAVSSLEVNGGCGGDKDRNLYEGLCPAGAQVGDLIVVLCGGTVPYLVRETGRDYGTYHFVGECYVAGGMYGELVKGSQEHEMPNGFEVFSLV